MVCEVCVRAISREDLYEQVWSRPMIKAAAEYVTSTALKKTCNRHKIPTPERGYWAKLENHKPVRRVALPKPIDARLDRVHVNGGTSERLPERVSKAGTEARERLIKAPGPAAATALTGSGVEEPSILGATRRAICKARPDAEGFTSVQGRGIVCLKIAPGSVDRTLGFLGGLRNRGISTQNQRHWPRSGCRRRAIAFAIEERPRKTPHEPTAAELKRRDDNLRWGNSRPAWPKYEYSPSGQLAIVVHANSYSGLRHSYSNGKTQSIGAMPPEIIAGLVEHGALLRERRRAAEERERQQREAEARRRREGAFNAREKRRSEFVEEIHDHLLERSRLSAVLTHLESSAVGGASRAQSISLWIQRRIKQIDALTSPDFLDLSARSARLSFVEPSSDPDSADQGAYYGYPSTPRLQFWSIDEQKELATSINALE